MNATTPMVKVDVTTEYLEDAATDSKDKYAFAYKIVIRNISTEQVKLLNRFWLITDANGKKTEVRGPGVVGEQPVIEAGKSYRYSSGAILDTPMGVMEGHYEMELSGGGTFLAPIAPFTLSVPHLIN